ncbi:MAG: hypothetical protein RRC07_09560 [Anaerolineae bacterium]|nr:hypothetical protein [Anaerolineae bacterium]
MAKNRIWLAVVAVALVLLTACGEGTAEQETAARATADSSHELKTATVPPAETATVERATATAAFPTATATPSPAATASATALPATSEPTATAATMARAGTRTLIVNHETLAAFDEMPAEAIAAASELRLLFRHASVGHNIDNGLNCLQNTFEQRPNSCDRGLASDEILYDSVFDRSKWTFEFHSPPPGQNPGWWNKVNFFVERVNNLAPEEQYDVISFKLGYVDGLDDSYIAEAFFAETWQGDTPTITDIEALQAAHPDRQLVLWTMGLARIVGTANSASFNEQMRAYVLEHGGVLLDIADIESHNPDGNLCTHDGFPALCPEYTEEARGGHLNARGSQRLAKAVWILMAMLAGWDGP